MMRKIGGWNAARRMLAAAPQRFRRAMDQAVLQEAHLHRKEIVEGLTTGSPGGKELAPLAPSTLATRRARGIRGTKPLIARGDLRRAITVVRTPRGVFVGILRTARGRDGQQLVNVAKVHELGKVVVLGAALAGWIAGTLGASWSIATTPKSSAASASRCLG